MHKHNHNSKHIGLTILLNLIITISEYVGGIFSGSLALVSDAGHNFSDVISLILSYFGEKFSEKKATKTHTFGFKRVEIFTALINALTLLAVGTLIVVEAISRFNSKENISIFIMLGVATIGLFGNLISLFVLQKDKDSNLNMKAAYLHLFYDTISSVAVIASAVIIYFTKFVVLDVIVSIFIALMIFWSGVGITKSAIHIFMQGCPEGIDFEKVNNTILQTDGVRSVHSLHIWSINSEEIFLSGHICVQDTNSDTDSILKKINASLEKEYGISHTTLQIEKTDLCSSGVICNK